MDPQRAPRGPRALLGAVGVALLLAHARAEDVLVVDMLDNGAFDAPPARTEGARRAARVPWWTTARGTSQIEERDGRPALRTGPGEFAEQPVAAYAPLVDGLVVRGQVLGRGVLTVTDGHGAQARIPLPVGAGGDGFASFELDGIHLREALGATPVPRLRVRLEAAEGETALWRDLAVLVPLPAPSRDELRAEVIAELEWILSNWQQLGEDRVGTPTTFIAHLFDVVTGQPTTPIPGGHSTYSDVVVAAARAAPEVPGWSEKAAAVVRDVLERAFHPTTGLPRTWDCAADRPIDDQFLEVAAHLAFLIDAAEDGPADLRAQARALCARAGRTLLDHALLPDGEVCAKLRSADAATNLGYSHLRRLDLPAQLARLWALLGDEDYRHAALLGVAALEYDHAWPGSWDSIDPGFDDNFGHFGARAVVLWRAAPDVAPFRRMALSGWRYFRDPWEDALRFGGQVAADQVRGWVILAQLAELEPSLAPEIAPVLWTAAKSHVRGQQYGDGTWGDVSINAFGPKEHLEIGDTLGVPQNLLLGLAVLHDEDLAAVPGGPDLREVRALFAAVLRTSRAAYRREHGYLPGRAQVPGLNQSTASLRVAVGLVELLERL